MAKKKKNRSKKSKQQQEEQHREQQEQQKEQQEEQQEEHKESAQEVHSTEMEHESKQTNQEHVDNTAKNDENQQRHDNGKGTDNQSKENEDQAPRETQRDEEPLVEKVPKEQEEHLVSKESSEPLESVDITAKPSKQQEEEDSRWFGSSASSWSSWLSESTTSAMKTMQTKSNQVGKSIQKFMQDELVGKEGQKQQRDQTKKREGDKDGEGASKWVDEASSLVSSWWNAAKSAEEVSFMRTIAEDMGRNVFELGKTLVEETDELISGGESTSDLALNPENQEVSWLAYYHQHAKGESFPQKSLIEWFQEMNAEKAQKQLEERAAKVEESLNSFLNDSDAPDDVKSAIELISNTIVKQGEGSVAPSTDDEEQTAQLDLIRENSPCGRELQRIIKKSEKFSEKLLSIQKEFFEYAKENIDSKQSLLKELTGVTFQLQQHLELEGNRMLAQIAKKSIGHLTLFADHTSNKENANTLPFEFRIKNQEENDLSLESVANRAREYVLFVVRDLGITSRQFATTSHKLGTLLEENKGEESISQEYETQTRRIPTKFIVNGNQACELVMGSSEHFSTILQSSQVDSE